jgi:hypothetical protein
MDETYLQCPGSESADCPIAADAFLREESDQEDDEEEDEEDEHDGDDEDEDDDGDEGYSE